MSSMKLTHCPIQNIGGISYIKALAQQRTVLKNKNILVLVIRMRLNTIGERVKKI
jgi:hypothetical protein